MGEQVQRMDSFRLLLNEISHELTDQNLQSLILIYGVPFGVRKQLYDGLAFFNYLITQDFISREKISNLHNLIRKMRPRRKDLVVLVEKYMKKEFQPADVRLFFDNLSGSWSLNDSEQTRPAHRCRSPESIHDQKTVCKIECAYLNCACHRIPSCYAPIVLLLVFATVGTAVIWYADVPKISHNIGPDLKKAGVYILGLEVFALVVVIGYRFRRYLVSCLKCRRFDYTVLTNPAVNTSIQVEQSRQIVQSTSPPDRFRSAPRQYRMSGSESAVFSNESGDPCSSMSTFGTFETTLEKHESSGTEGTQARKESPSKC